MTPHAELGRWVSIQSTYLLDDLRHEITGMESFPNGCVTENVVYPIVPNGFADHEIPMKNG